MFWKVRLPLLLTFAVGLVPIVTFFLVLILYFVVTFERIDLCMRIGLEHCR
jgi:hypothetical protein